MAGHEIGHKELVHAQLLVEPLVLGDKPLIYAVAGFAHEIQHRIGNMLRCKFHVCPLCGNVIHTLGDSLVSCCGITLPPLEAETPDEAHALTVETVEDEHFITVHHPMTKAHFISFLAFVTADRLQMVKLYPEGNAETRLQLRGVGYLYYYCNHHGLFRTKK